MMSASSIDGPLDASTVCPISAASVEKSENDVSNDSTSAVPPDSTGSKEPARTRPSFGPLVPADVDDDRVAERRPLADELAVRDGQVGEVPVQAGVEACGETRRDVRGEHGRAEEHCVGARLLDERRERVHPRLRKRRGQLGRFARVDLRGAERACACGDP